MMNSFTFEESTTQAVTQGIEVRVVDFDIAFPNLVWLMIKIAAASIPAMIAVGAAIFIGGAILAEIAGEIGMLLR
jgi:hypothetical protein